MTTSRSKPSYYLTLVPEAFRSGFSEWINDNVHVWRHVVGEALRAIHLGKRHGAINLIIEHARWETYLRSHDEPFKMPDQWTSSMARLFALVYPEYASFFSFRERKDSVLMPLEKVHYLIKIRTDHEQDRPAQDDAAHRSEEGSAACSA